MYRARADAVQGRYVLSGGRRLICIGNAAVSPGDFVWTDGRCVYGHHRTCGAPYIPVGQEEEPGIFIPILLSGGQYLFYDIKSGLHAIRNGEVHAAMVNQRDGYTFIDEDVLDAERDNGGNVYIIREGYYALRKVTGYELPNYEIRSYMGAVSVTSVDYPNFVGEPDNAVPGRAQSAEEYISCFDSAVYSQENPGEENVPVRIVRNGEIIASVNLRPFVEENIAEKVADYASEIEDYMAPDVETVYPSFRTQPDSFLKSIEAKVIAAKVDTGGNYCLIVDVTAEQIFFPWLAFENPRYSITAHNVRKVLNGGWRYRYEHTESLTPMGGMVKAWLHGSAKYTKRLKITSRGAEIIKSGYTASVLKPWLSIYDGVHEAESTHGINSREAGDGFLMDAYGVSVRPNDSSFKGSWEKDIRGWLSGEEIYEISVSMASNLEFITYTGVEAAHLVIHPSSHPGIFTRKTETAEKRLVLPVQDGFYYVPGEEDSGVLYALDGTKVAEGCFPADGNLCACKVGEQAYLIGVHGEALYVCRDGVLSEITGELANYRLRPLENMESWKKKGE